MASIYYYIDFATELRTSYYETLALINSYHIRANSQSFISKAREKVSLSATSRKIKQNHTQETS